MNYQLVATPSEELESKGLAGLRAFNRSQSPSFYTKLEATDSSKTLNVFAFDDSGALAGGLLGTAQLSWLKTEILFVEEAHRKHGVGRELMQRAENEARTRGCTRAYVDTMQWQARGFYEMLGYRVAGELPDWDSHGHAKYFLIKRL